MARPTFRFAHLADAHVGAWPREPAIRAALRSSVLRALDVVLERKCEFLLISGDLFHTPVPEPGEVAPVAAKMRSLVEAGIRIYVIYGSHDYVAHRTSWLDVLAETGLFLRAAPEPVRAEGDRWTLRFLIDPPTGAVISGISGRSRSLDAAYFRSVDSEAFRAEPGFHIFQFHAAIREYLPPSLREHVEGISRDELPRGCDYYAGGHIHSTYVGTGPDGGLLVNPGAVFGTQVPDLERGARGESHQGVVIVSVANGVPVPEFVDTAPRDAVAVVDLDLEGGTQEQIRETLAAEIGRVARPGALVFSRFHGTPSGGSKGIQEIAAAAREIAREGNATVHLDLSDVHWPGVVPAGAAQPESEQETETVRELARLAPKELPALAGPGGERLIEQLFHELRLPRAEGESVADYRAARIDGSLSILGIHRKEREGSSE